MTTAILGLRGDAVGVANLHAVSALNLGALTARGAEDMRHTLSPFGRRLVSFLSEGPREGTA
jgi:hypothetical protein